jgi:DNA-binding MarR family transcriptional regulator
MSNLFKKLQSEIAAYKQVEGITIADVLTLAPELRHTLNAITRQGGMGLAEIVPELGMSANETKILLDMLVEKGYLTTIEKDGSLLYKTSLARKRKSSRPDYVRLPFETL